MFELKQEPEIARDKVTAAAGRLLAEIRALLVLGLEDEGLKHALQRGEESIASALEAVLARRRANGERPDTGLQERGQFEAVGLQIKSTFSADSEAHVVADSLLPTVDALAGCIADAREFTGTDEVLDNDMQRLAETVAGFRDALRQMT